jgi:hypothetical protein
MFDAKDYVRKSELSRVAVCRHNSFAILSHVALSPHAATTASAGETWKLRLEVISLTRDTIDVARWS